MKIGKQLWLWWMLQIMRKQITFHTKQAIDLFEIWRVENFLLRHPFHDSSLGRSSMQMRKKALLTSCGVLILKLKRDIGCSHLYVWALFWTKSKSQIRTCLSSYFARYSSIFSVDCVMVSNRVSLRIIIFCGPSNLSFYLLLWPIILTRWMKRAS